MEASSEVVKLDPKPFKDEGAALVAKAKALVIADLPGYQAAAEFLRDMADLKKRVESKVGPVVKANHVAWKTSTALREEMLKDPQEADELVREKMTRWKREDDRRQAEAAAKAQREEQERLDAIALAEAEQLEKAGEPELAQMVVEQAPVAAPIPIAKPKAEGVATVTRWTFALLPETISTSDEDVEAELMEAAALMLAAPDASVPARAALVAALRAKAKVIRSRLKRAFMLPDMVKIRQQVNSLKKDAEGFVKGIRVSAEESLSVRGRP